MYIRQPSFLGGEISPLLWGRTDLDLFARSLRRCRNFFPSRHGAAVSRPGSTYITTTRDSSDNNCRLIPFRFSNTQSYAIEVGKTVTGNLYFRFFTQGGALTSSAAPFLGGPYEVIGGTTTADLNLLKWAQTGDILTLTHPSWPPLELRRLPDVAGDPHWTLSPVVFSVASPYFSSVAAGGYPVLKSPVPVDDATHPKKEWIWLATLSVQDIATGRTFETMPRRIAESWDGVAGHLPVALADDQVAIYPDRPATILRGNHLELSLNTAITTYRELGTNYYRGRGDPFGPSGIFGFVGNTTTDTFVDTGAEPDYSKQPPRGTNPFLTYDRAGLLQPVEHPAAVAFFQERRVFAGTGKRPSTIFFSASGQYTNYDEHIIQVADESLLYELAARRLEEVIHVVSGTKLLAFTRSSVWSFGGSQGEALQPGVVPDARLEDEVGAIDLVPLVIDGAVVFARAKGSGVRALQQGNFQGFVQGNYQGIDISTQSDHLFVGESPGFQGVASSRKLIDWTYAQDPWGLVWAVRADGVLLSLTTAGESRGWARHDGGPTSLGSTAWYRGVCAVPEGDEDAVYLLVTRAVGGSYGKTCVERMTSRVRRQSPEDDACVDCSVRYEGNPTLRLNGLDHLKGEQVWAVSVGNPPYGPLPVTVDGTGLLWGIDLPELPKPNKGGVDAVHTGGQVVMYVGLLFTPQLETLDLASTNERTKQKTVTKVGIEVDQTRGLWAGQDFEHLKEWQQRDVAASYSAPVPGTQLIRMPISGTWSERGQMAVEQRLPLPMTVTALVREVVLGDS